MDTKGEWKITSNPIGGQMYYSVYRLRNIYELDHSGNREYAMGWTPDRSIATKKLEEMRLNDSN